MRGTVSMSSPGSPSVIHFLAWAERCGATRMVLNLCRAMPETRPAVWLPRPGPAARDFEHAGIPCYTNEDLLRGPAAARERFSLMHIHCGIYEPAAHRAARRLGLRSLATLHTRAVLPELDCPLVCVAAHTAALQDPFNRVRVIPNAVDTARFTPASAPRAAGDRLVILRVCRPERCAPYFLDAMRGVLARHAGAELWLAGEEGVTEGAVRYLGTRDDVPELLRRADVFAYAPLEDGAHDVCVLEAMAAGVPPVLTDVAPVRESVTHGHDGLLVPYGDAGAFAAAVERVLDDAGLRETLGRNARRTAEERFSLERLAADYRRGYADALAEPPPAPEDDMRRTVRRFVAARLQRESFERNLALLHDTLEATPLAGRYWVIGGLLLGWAREGGVLAHDSRDADFAMLEEDRERLEAALPALASAGFEPLARYVHNWGRTAEYALRKDGARFDFFLLEPAGGALRCTYFGVSPRAGRPRPIQIVSQTARYEIGTMEFLGRRWRKPADHGAFLAAEYGDWRTPDPGFDHRSDSPSVVEVWWWENAGRSRFEG